MIYEYDIVLYTFRCEYNIVLYAFNMYMMYIISYYIILYPFRDHIIKREQCIVVSLCLHEKKSTFNIY